MSHTKFGPDRFSRFDVYWIQTNRQTDKLNSYIDKHHFILQTYIYIYFAPWKPSNCKFPKPVHDYNYRLSQDPDMISFPWKGIVCDMGIRWGEGGGTNIEHYRNEKVKVIIYISLPETKTNYKYSLTLCTVNYNLYGYL